MRLHDPMKITSKFFFAIPLYFCTVWLLDDIAFLPVHATQLKLQVQDTNCFAQTKPTTSQECFPFDLQEAIRVVDFPKTPPVR